MSEQEGHARHPHRWGYADSRLELDGPRSVRMNGDRDAAERQSMPHLIPFVEQMLGLPFDPASKIPVVPPMFRRRGSTPR